MGFGKDFGRGLAKTGPASAQQAAFLALRQALEEPRTEAELQMRERQMRLSEDENRIRMDLLREQISNSRADTQWESESRARASSPEALDRQKRLDEAEIGGKEALKGQREQQKALLGERLAAIEKDPEKLKALELFKNSDAVRFAQDPGQAAAAIAQFLTSIDAEFAKRRGTAPKAKGAPKGEPKAAATAPIKMKLPDGRVVPIKPDMVEAARKAGAVEAE